MTKSQMIKLSALGVLVVGAIVWMCYLMIITPPC